MKSCLYCLLITLYSQIYAQTEHQLRTIQPNTDYENIHVKKLNSDSSQTSFVIWVKKNVKEHCHAFHTENIYVIEGKAKMTLNDSTFIVRKEITSTFLKEVPILFKK